MLSRQRYQFRHILEVRSVQDPRPLVHDRLPRRAQANHVEAPMTTEPPEMLGCLVQRKRPADEGDIALGREEILGAPGVAQVGGDGRGLRGKVDSPEANDGVRMLLPRGMVYLVSVVYYPDPCSVGMR